MMKAHQIRAVELLDAPTEIFLLPCSNHAQKNLLPMRFGNRSVWSRMAVNSFFYSVKASTHEGAWWPHGSRKEQERSLEGLYMCGHIRVLYGPLAGACGHHATTWLCWRATTPILMLEWALSPMFNAQGSQWYSKVFKCDQNDSQNTSNLLSKLRVCLKYPET